MIPRVSFPNKTKKQKFKIIVAIVFAVISGAVITIGAVVLIGFNNSKEFAFMFRLDCLQPQHSFDTTIRDTVYTRGSYRYLRSDENRAFQICHMHSDSLNSDDLITKNLVIGKTRFVKEKGAFSMLMINDEDTVKINFQHENGWLTNGQIKD